MSAHDVWTIAGWILAWAVLAYSLFMVGFLIVIAVDGVWIAAKFVARLLRKRQA